MLAKLKRCNVALFCGVCVCDTLLVWVESARFEAILRGLKQNRNLWYMCS